jgi:antitoxin CptB
MTVMKDIDMDMTRLKWQCRRGMLELDLLLESFLETQYPLLDKEQKHQFREMLEIPDPELYAFLMGKKKTKDGLLDDIIKQVRSSY